MCLRGKQVASRSQLGPEDRDVIYSLGFSKTHRNMVLNHEMVFADVLAQTTVLGQKLQKERQIGFLSETHQAEED